MPLFHSNAMQVGWAPSIVVGASRRARPAVQRVGLAPRHPPLRLDLLQLHRQAARVPARATGAARRRRQPVAGRVRQRRIARGRRRVLAPLRCRGDRRVRRDRGRHRGQPRCRGARRRARAGAGQHQDRRRGRQREAVARFDDDGRLVNADECVGEIVNTAGVGPFEGYYNNAAATDEDHALRLVLVGRPRVPRRRPLPLLRGPQRRLDPRRRRELPGRADRGDAARRAGRRPRRGLRRARRPGRRPGDGRPRAARRRGFRSGRVRGAGSTRRRRSARSGARATCACCAIRRRRARTRS